MADPQKSKDKADQVIAFIQVCRVVPFESGIAFAAVEICRALELATADAIIFATAHSRRATLLACDAHLMGLPDVTYVPKTDS